MEEIEIRFHLQYKIVGDIFEIYKNWFLRFSFYFWESNSAVNFPPKSTTVCRQQISSLITLKIIFNFK